MANETFLEISANGRNIILSPQNTIAQENTILESSQKIN
jgi:hypothetical protein